MKYRKKPITIEAMQVTRNFIEVVIAWIPQEILGEYNLGEFAEDECFVEVYSLEGLVKAGEGDYVVKGVFNEFYVCSEEIFEFSYEKVEE